MHDILWSYALTAHALTTPANTSELGQELHSKSYRNRNSAIFFHHIFVMTKNFEELFTPT